MKLSAVYLVLACWPNPSWALRQASITSYCSIFKNPLFDHQNCQPDIPVTFVEDTAARPERRPPRLVYPRPLELAYRSLVDLQREFWAHRRGTWPRAIDWTAAFIHTSLAGMADTLSRALDNSCAEDVDASMVRNMVDSYFTQIVGFYFGQNRNSLRRQAFDDILWVVLGWLESTNLIDSHSALHYPREDTPLRRNTQFDLGDTLASRPWHGNDWTDAFAHRSREFWELATKGWGETLCGGGMRWSPHLLVYKNAITNQLWVAASAKMYLDHPGDGGAWNRTYLESAVKGYEWLMGVNMTNPAGLFVDGYHISRVNENNTRCDVREESVYTYNQGVLLTGQRALWEATGSPAYLMDGHQLVQNVIRATGWHLEKDAPLDEVHRGRLPPWRGIGRAGILEERCDSTGRCSQNGHTFKGIYFHHLTYFCAPVTPVAAHEVDDDAWAAVAAAHAEACGAYIPWVAHNAKAALTTRNERGVFGMWWGAEKYGREVAEVWESDDPTDLGRDTADYRNFGIPDDGVWRKPGVWQDPLPGVASPESDGSAPELPRQGGSGSTQQVVGGGPRQRSDLNDRGRGRTVETHNSGMSVVRAWWELSQAYGDRRPRRIFGAQWLISGMRRLWVMFLHYR